jgi:1-acyl-sn-glycerol-3-phosphate acyltransferase
MMRPALRQARRSIDVAADLTILWAAARFLAPRLDPVGRRRLSTRLARRTLATLRIRAVRSGESPPADEPMLVVANHVSWLDVYVLNASRPMRFVAKSETRTWPIIGTIASRFDSIFIVRGRYRDAARVKTRVAEALRAGESVGVFPEATTTAGHEVKPFHAAMFQAALDAGVRVLPVAIRYPGPDGRPNPAAAFIDDMSFGSSLLRVVGEPWLDAEVRFGTPLAAPGRSRRELAAAAHAFIVNALARPASFRKGSSERARREPPPRGAWWPLAGHRPTPALP